MSGSKDRSNGGGTGKNIFGSERVTSGHGVFRSGILKRSSRRTVSASHISPSSIFAPIKGSDAPLVTCSNRTHKTGRCDCGQAVKHFYSERDIQTAARLQALMAQNMDTEETGTDEGEGRVGRYLFGNELSNMSFGDFKELDPQDQMSMEVLTSTPIEEITTLDDSSEGNRTSYVIDGFCTAFFDSLLYIGLISNIYIFQQNHHAPVSPQRPSSPPNDRQSTSSSNSSSLKYSSKQRPQIPNLEPRSAVAEYTSSCSSIVYKKQRSMSLQDADLLTADQFIALMPDDIAAKRRFSSEEKPGENTWHATVKRVTTPDPATTLHSLMSTLKVTCGNVLDQLATVLAPLSNGSVHSSISTTTFSTTPPSSNSLSSEVSTTPESNRSERETAPNSNREQVLPKILIRVEATSDVEDGEHGQSDTAASNNECRANDIPRHRTQPIAIKKPTMPQHATQEHDSLASSNMFPNFDQQDLVETIWILFNDLEQVVVKMLSILRKYIATDQFAKLLKESDEMGELSQQIFRAEMDRRERWIEQQLDQEMESKLGAHRAKDTMDGSNRPGAFNGQARAASSIHPSERPGRELHTNDHLPQTSDQINGISRSGNGNHAEQRHSHLPLHLGDTKGTMTGITNRIRHRRSRDHVRMESFSRPQDETVKDESSSLEGKQDIVRDYIRSLLEMAEISVAEYMRTYSRLLIVPTAGYRIEGCNDSKKIERAAAALSGHSRGRRSSLFMPSSTTSPPNLLQQSLLTKMSGHEYQEPAEVEGTDSLRTDASETRVSITSMASQSSSDLALTQSQFGGGYAMVRVKSLPESKDEWAALQKRKEMGSGAGVGEVIATGMAPTPSVTSGPSPIGIGGGAGGIGPVGAVGVGDMGGRILPSDLSMMGDYSKEHMGHEAYYYRNWFLGKEHRTFVGQVEGLGTVIISIIKDMVVPTEARQTIPVFRSNTGPGAISHSSTSIALGAAISGPLNGVSAGHPRPDLVHSAQSYYPGRGGQSFSPVGSIAGRSGGLTATPRTSSEAMRYVDSLRITLPEPEPSPLNNLTRRTGKPQWKTILQSIHPAITQQVASKLKKVQNNQHFEKELATFDETMLRFNYKFGVLLVRPGQKHEEDWFGNQTGASDRFQEFLESGALGQKVALKGFERFSAGLDTRLGETGKHSYFDTWGDGFEIMYHVSTMLPFNTLDPQQIQRKRHIGNDIVCIVFVDGDQPFVPNTIKSQFLHIFVIVHPITLPDGTRGYSATIACDEQVPEFGPPLPDPPIFRNPVELRAFLLCKMINGENAAYKAPRLIKPHQRARSGLLENLVAKANTLAKDSSKKQKAVSQHRPVLLRTAPAIVISPVNTIASTSATITIIRLRAFPDFLLIRMDTQYATPPNRR
ncbi:Rap1 GTPase-activating protein 2 [Podila verticillata]|nr:Rap1 GTPase-activating protein 2 [Podila verticillata]